MYYVGDFFYKHKMKKILTFALLSFILLTTGCMNSSELTYETPQQLELATGAQDAVFYVTFGWVGGPAGAPVIDLESGRPIEMNGDDVYLDDAAYTTTEKLMETKNELESNIVKVSANVDLLPDTTGEIMLPPSEDDGAPIIESRGYTALRINEIYDVLAVDKWGRKP